MTSSEVTELKEVTQDTRTIKEEKLQDSTSISQVQTSSKDIFINTFEQKAIEISTSRNTVSYMEVLNVEDQLIQVFCEQVYFT